MKRFVSIVFNSNLVLNREGYSVGYSYYSRIKALKFIKYARINIIIQDRDGDVEIVGLDDSICNINYPFSIITYTGLPKEMRRAALYEVVFKTMKYLSVANDWDESEIEQVNKSIIEDEYVVPISYFKRKKSPLKERSAELNFTLDFDCAQFFWKFFNRDNRLENSILIYRSVPVDMLYPIFFDSYEWVNEEEIVIKDLYGEILFICNALTGIVKIDFKPKDRTEEELRLKLIGFDCNTDELERQKLIGLIFG